MQNVEFRRLVPLPEQKYIFYLLTVKLFIHLDSVGVGRSVSELDEISAFSSNIIRLDCTSLVVLKVPQQESF